MIDRADRIRPTWSDVGLAGFMLFLAVMGLASAARLDGRPAAPAAYALAALTCVPVTWWRWRPVPATVAIAAVETLYAAAGYPDGPVLFALMVGIYGVTSRVRSRTALVTVTGVLAARTGAAGIDAATRGAGWAGFALLLLPLGVRVLASAAVGLLVRQRRESAAVLRAEQARRVVSEERLRLAQELHDVVGHGLAVIAMHAGVGLRILDRDPGRARRCLEAIRSASTEALDGLRAELDLLHQAPPPVQGVPAPSPTPGPGTADLPALVERIRAAGLPITADLPIQDLAHIPAPTALAAYRIVQEALTNVLRHGGPAASASVRVVQAGDTLDVEVADTGQGCPSPIVTGHGITGMHRRTRALTGTLEVGPRPGGGFAVRARLPCPVSTPEGPPPMSPSSTVSGAP